MRARSRQHAPANWSRHEGCWILFSNIFSQSPTKSKQETTIFLLFKWEKKILRTIRIPQKCYSLPTVPYTKVFQLRFSKKDLHFVRYKLSHSDQDFQKVSVRKRQRSSLSMLAVQAMGIHPKLAQLFFFLESRQKINNFRKPKWKT